MAMQTWLAGVAQSALYALEDVYEDYLRDYYEDYVEGCVLAEHLPLAYCLALALLGVAVIARLLRDSRRCADVAHLQARLEQARFAVSKYRQQAGDISTTTATLGQVEAQFRCHCAAPQEVECAGDASRQSDGVRKPAVPDSPLP